MKSTPSGAPSGRGGDRAALAADQEAVLRMQRCKITVEDVSGTVFDYIFDQETIYIGSSEDNDLVIPDTSVSRQHAMIVRRGEDYLIRDLESTNGTFAGSLRVTEAYLRPGMVVRVGNVEFRFKPLSQRIEIVPSEHDRFGDIVGASVRMREIFAVLERIATTDATVLIEGETGTGKEVVARTLHKRSLRAQQPFVVVDCGAIPDNLLESELFGHEKGAFTGAVSSRSGLVEQANGGTLFLDEIGELGRELQPKLLRVLERREVKRVGSNRTVRVDVRFVAATNRGLREEVEADRFREDLYYRLNVVRLKLPALKERAEDIPVLARHYLSTRATEHRGAHANRIEGITREALDALMSHSWPGNVRELMNVVERASFFADGSFIDVGDLPEIVTGRRKRAPRLKPDDETARNTLDAGSLKNFHDAKEEWLRIFERDYIQKLLARNNWNISRAAREAGVDRKHLRNLLKKHALDVATLKRTMD